jgi:FeS assembly SUF system protein
MMLKDSIIKELRNIYDPEIPVNIYDLGLIYDINIGEKGKVVITMTLTSPNCPIADNLLMDIEKHISYIKGVNDLKINLVFDPPWDRSMMSDEALLELGML